MRKDVIIEIVFYEVERANEKMGVICISTLIMQEMQNMPQDGIELEGIRGVPETEGRPQTGDNVPSGNGRKEDGQ